MSCLMNCNTCHYKKINQDQLGWCYMFREEPNGECRQHTGSEKEKQAYMSGSIVDRVIGQFIGGYKTFR